MRESAELPVESVVWPWGRNNPSKQKRLIVAGIIALLTSTIFYVIHFVNQGPPSASPMNSDFSLIWYGARLLSHGGNPYELIGPGLQIEHRWNALYPATAYILAIPLTLIGERWASVVFTAISSFLLAFGATRDSWHRLPMFASVAFLTGAILGQLSVLMTAVLFLPWLAVISCAKPQTALPLVITSRRRLLIAVAGGVAVLATSLILLPEWPRQWFRLVQASSHLRPPILSFGGFLILLALVRWKRAEAWIVVTMALMPQTWYPYNWIVFLALPNTFRQACVLGIVSSIGGLAGEYAVYGMPVAQASSVGGAFSVAFAYLPATLMILRRPNARSSQWQ